MRFQLSRAPVTSSYVTVQWCVGRAKVPTRACCLHTTAACAAELKVKKRVLTTAPLRGVSTSAVSSRARSLVKKKWRQGRCCCVLRAPDSRGDSGQVRLGAAIAAVRSWSSSCRAGSSQSELALCRSAAKHKRG